MTFSLEPTPVTSAPSAIATPDLVRLAQGFYFIFWGLLVAVLVGAQIMLVFWVHSFAEIFLAAGVLAVLASYTLASGLLLWALFPLILRRYLKPGAWRRERLALTLDIDQALAASQV